MTVLLAMLFLLMAYPVIGPVLHDLRARRAKQDASSFSGGDSIETDCRACGQFNRVPVEQLRDCPKCGRCKKRLMPGKRLVIVRVKSMGADLQRDLDACWSDEERLWSVLADHQLLRRHAEASKHVVN